MRIDPRTMEWTREPRLRIVTRDKVEIVTEPNRDLWQRTYYHFRDNNAPLLQLSTEGRYAGFENRLSHISSILKHHRQGNRKNPGCEPSQKQMKATVGGTVYNGKYPCFRIVRETSDHKQQDQESNGNGVRFIPKIKS